jgi:3-phosphoshikimate 1-carboxyvinyltransferase
VSRHPVQVRVPGDKSISHRALIFAAMATGESRVAGLLDSADTRATAAALRELGLDIPAGRLDELRITGKGTTGLTAPARVLDCANSGTTARLLLGALAGCPFRTILTGDDSLQARPMRRVTEPLSAAGARFEELRRNDRLPIAVTGARPLQELRWRSPQPSAQVKSALLLAGLTGRAAVTVSEAVQSRDHSERMLAAMGASVVCEADDQGHTVRMAPTDRLDPIDVLVPGDFSAAAFFLALGALRGPVRVAGVGLNPGRTGAMHVIQRMGARVEATVEGTSAGEPVGSVRVEPAALDGVHVTADEVPALLDEIPILAALAARARGETRFDGVAELRVKESDRIDAVQQNLRALGVATEAGPDHLMVMGGAGPLRGRVRAFHDHRIAMAFGVLGALPGNEIQVEGADAVAISFPDFWERLQRVTEELDRP